MAVATRHVHRRALRRARGALTPDRRVALACAWEALWASRLVVWAAGIGAVLAIGRAPNTTGFDPGRITEPFGLPADLLLAPAARWDATWFLGIAEQGYADEAQSAFLPLYPLLVAALGVVGVPLAVAGVLVSLAALLIALTLLHRLVILELGGDGAAARACVLAVAFFPAAFFLSAIYSEALFLALSLGTFLAARRGRWAWAGVVGALAAATRTVGVALVVPFVVLFLWGPRADVAAAGAPAGDAAGWRRLRPRHRPTPALAWVLAIPLGLGLYLTFIAVVLGDPFAPFDAQAFWLRELSLPFAAVVDGALAAWDGLRQLLSGTREPVIFTAAGGDPFDVAWKNLMLFAFLIWATIALVGALRTLPLAYGAYALAALALPLSSPVPPQPLMSLPRFLAVLFPLQMWAALRAVRRGTLARDLAVSGGLLALLCALFATWRFVG